MVAMFLISLSTGEPLAVLRPGDGAARGSTPRSFRGQSGNLSAVLLQTHQNHPRRQGDLTDDGGDIFDLFQPGDPFQLFRDDNGVSRV